MSTHESETIGLDSATADVEVMPTCCVGETLSGRYSLDEEIGCGGMGIVYAMQAAADAATLFAYTDSLHLYEQARDSAEALGMTDELAKIDTAIGDVYSLKGEPLNAARHYERALAATEDPTESLRLKCLLGEAYVVVGDTRALTYLEEAKTTLDPATQPAEFARATMIEGRFHHYHGCSGKAAELLLQAREAAERSGDIMLLAWIQGYLAGAYQQRIEFEESNRWSRKNVDLGEANDNPHIGSMGFEYLMENAFMRGYWRQSLEYAARHRELGERAGSSDRLAWNYVPVTYANYGLGNLVVAETACDDGLEIARCHALVATGRLDEAAQRLETTLESARKADMPHWEGMALKVRGQLHLARGDEEGAREDFDAAIEIFEKLESRIELGRTLVLRGEDEDLERARELFEACGAAADLHRLSS